VSPILRIFVVVAGLAALSAAPAEPKPPSKDQIAKWIKQLGDTEFAVREKASEELYKAVVDDESEALVASALQAVRKSDDAEVVRRAGEILEKLESGIRANTPKEIVDLWERFRGGDDAAKQEALKGLFSSGKSGMRVVRKLIDGEKDPNAKAALWQQIAQEAAVILPVRMAEGDNETVEELLNMSLSSSQPGAQMAYAAYWLRRGKLAERIRALETGTWPNPENRAATLAPLYRVQGNFKKAREAAENSKNEEMVNAILFDQGAWKELAERTAKAATGSADPNLLGLLARYQRLAGDGTGADDTLARIRDNAKKDPFNAELQQSPRALLLNGRCEDALELLSAGAGCVDAVELYCARNQFREALRIIDARGANDPPALTKELEVLRARTIYLLGDRANAVKRFTDLGENIGKKTAPLGQATIEHPPAQMIPGELRLGLKDLAYQHLAALLTPHQDQPELLPGLMEPAFPDRGEAAAVWWQYLRHKHPKDEPAETMKRLRELMEGRLTPKEFSPQAEEAMALAADLPLERKMPWLLALADLCHDAGADGPYKSCLEKAVIAAEAVAKAQNNAPNLVVQSFVVQSGLPLIRIGDYYANTKDWTHAAENYGRAWEKDRRDPLPAYLRGLALVEAGQEKEGKRLMELAHDLPLADAQARYAFAWELDKRGHADAARIECDMIVRINGYDDPWHTEEALKALALHHRIEKNYAKAADCYERSIVCHLHGESEFRLAMGNLAVPAAMHFNYAMVFLTADKLDEARKAIQTCLDLSPGDVNLPILLTPVLEKGGHKKDADDLFAKVWAVHEGLCKDHPKSAWGHNNAAWLAVRCRRKLDEALKHAKQAVELAPDQPGYLDTLAEAYFQKGDQEKALELIKKCIKIDPKYAYYQRQLKRIEAGDPSADVVE
jgi:tetratricopeptide (TPR) repeat protein